MGARRGESRRGPAVARPAARRITALTLLIGDRSLVVGQADGSLVGLVPGAAGRRGRLDADPRSASSRRHAGPIRCSRRRCATRAFLAHDEAGDLGLYYSTSERALWRGTSPLPERRGARSSRPRRDGAFLAGGRHGWRSLDDRQSAPRGVSWRALFGKVWYEGYEEPRARLAVDRRHRRLRAQAEPDAARSSARSRARSTRSCSPSRSASWARCTPRSSCTRSCCAWSSRRSRSWPRCRAWCSASSPGCGSRRGSSARSRRSC